MTQNHDHLPGQPPGLYLQGDPDQWTEPGQAAELPGFAAAPPPDPPEIPAQDSPTTPRAGGRHAAPSSSGIPTSIPEFFKRKSRTYEEIARGAFRAAGGLLNQAVRAGDDDASFIPDDDDDESVPPPLGRLMARRVPIGGDDTNWSDMADLGAAGVGLLAWALKGLISTATARRERRRLIAGASVYHGDAAADGQAPA